MKYKNGCNTPPNKNNGISLFSTLCKPTTLLLRKTNPIKDMISTANENRNTMSVNGVNSNNASLTAIPAAAQISMARMIAM